MELLARSRLMTVIPVLLVAGFAGAPDKAQACEKTIIITALQNSAKSDDWKPKRLLRRLTKDRDVYRNCKLSFNVVLHSKMLDGITLRTLFEVQFVHQGSSVCLKYDQVERIDRKKYRLPPRRWYEFCAPVSLRTRQHPAPTTPSLSEK